MGSIVLVSMPEDWLWTCPRLSCCKNPAEESFASSAGTGYRIACAAVAAADLFVINDRRLQRKRVDRIQFMVSLDEAPI
jgi:hypothetical protein